MAINSLQTGIAPLVASPQRKYWYMPLGRLVPHPRQKSTVAVTDILIRHMHRNSKQRLHVQLTQNINRASALSAMIIGACAVILVSSHLSCGPQRSKNFTFTTFYLHKSSIGMLPDPSSLLRRGWYPRLPLMPFRWLICSCTYL